MTTTHSFCPFLVFIGELLINQCRRIENKSRKNDTSDKSHLNIYYDIVLCFHFPSFTFTLWALFLYLGAKIFYLIFLKTASWPSIR